MADTTLKIVQSPIIQDVDLPLPVHFNGLDQPVLDTYAIAGDYVKKSGDTMSGALIVKRDDNVGVLDTVPTITRTTGQGTLTGGTTRILAGTVLSSSSTALSNNDGSNILAELGIESQFPNNVSFALIDIFIHGFGS